MQSRSMFKRQENIIKTNLAALIILLRQYNWMNRMNISEIIWKIFQWEQYLSGWHAGDSCQELLDSQFNLKGL